MPHSEKCQHNCEGSPTTKQLGGGIKSEIAIAGHGKPFRNSVCQLHHIAG